MIQFLHQQCSSRLEEGISDHSFQTEGSPARKTAAVHNPNQVNKHFFIVKSCSSECLLKAVSITSLSFFLDGRYLMTTGTW